MITRTIKTALSFLLLLLAGCALSVDTTTLDFGSDKTTETLTVTVQGAVEWSINRSETWVTVDPDNGQGDGTHSITITVDRTGLTPGDYEATLNISAKPDLSCPDVIIKMSVLAAPPPVEPCPPPLEECNDICVHPGTDESNCGGCGLICDDGERCVGGVCVLNCQAHLTPCGTMCVDTQTDEENCGGCGDQYQCDSGEMCVGAVCTSLPACNSCCPSNIECDSCCPDCPDGYIVCDNECIDPSTNQEHCGATEGCVDGDSCELECFGGQCVSCYSVGTPCFNNPNDCCERPYSWDDSIEGCCCSWSPYGDKKWECRTVTRCHDDAGICMQSSQ